MRSFLAPLIVLALAVGCGPPEDPPPEFADTPLSGLVGGAEWTFQAAATDDFLSDEDGFFTSFFGEAVEDPCASFADPPHLLTQLPTSPGDYGMGFRRNLTFVVDEDGETNNLVATRGDMRIDDVDEEAGLITGAIITRFDADNDINGTFEATICPPD